VTAAVAAAALALGALAADAPAAAPPPRVLELGPTDAQRASRAATLEFSFGARADEELIGARVVVALAPTGSGAAVDVVVNDERVATWEPDGAPGARTIDVPRELLAPRNRLALRRRDPPGRCGEGSWRGLERVALELGAQPVPLPDDLALLPLPFVDRGFDDAATIAVALGGAPTPERVRAAALVASALAVDAPLPLSFTASAGLPDGRAVVLVDGEAAAARLGVPAPSGPSARMMDHPRHPGSNAKLLVVGGRDASELRAAAENLAANRGARLVGEEVRLPAPAADKPAAPYVAPRWVPSERAVAFGDYPESTSVLAHDGATSATLFIRFRVAPDLWIWPADHVVLDLGWSERIPQGAPSPRLAVEMNGYFLASLPARGGPGDHRGRVRLRIPREHMRGFNEVRVYASYPDPDPCAAGAASAGGGGDAPHVEIARDSVLHFEGFPHYASLPDVALFAFDGFPFTRVADLGDTAVVLPESPSDAEVSTALTVLARLAQITGRTGTRARFLSAAEAKDDAIAGKDLLVVGGKDNALASRWAGRLPIAWEERGARVQPPSTAAGLLDLLGGPGPLLDARRAQGVLAGAHEVAALAAIESPASRGRAAVFVGATAPTALPPFSEFLGYAESRAGSGDLLVLADGKRSMFRIASTHGRGDLDLWTRLRWFLANHWIVLVPVLAAAVLLLAPRLDRFLERRMRARLGAEARA
jgi:Bacterial cellulose synthase subunit